MKPNTDINYILYGEIWEHFNIIDIGFRYIKDSKIFETQLYFEDSLYISYVNDSIKEYKLYFTRFLNIYELIKLYNTLGVSIPNNLKI